MSGQTAWWEWPLERMIETLTVQNAAQFPFSTVSMTLPNLLSWALEALAQAGIERAGFEMQLLLAQALGISRVAVITGSHPPPSESQIRDFVRLIWARACHVPLAYLRSDQEFYGLPFRVTPAVLIPRPETEMLVDATLHAYRLAERALQGPFMVADVGTGSGCISIAILAHCPLARAVGYDISPDALAVARTNAVANGVVNRMRFIRGHLLTGAKDARYDVVVSNPPYISTSGIVLLQPEVREYEPPLALDGGPDGLDCYGSIVVDAFRVLKPAGGLLCVEVGQGQAQAVAEIFRASGLQHVKITPDLAGIERMVEGQK